MKKPTEHDEFNWVEARQHCSAAAQFKLLQQTVEENVTERNKQLGENAQVKLTVEKSDSGMEFSANQGSSSGLKNVTFGLKKYHIAVQYDYASDDDRNFTATPVLNNDLECRLKVEGEGECLRWQVAQKALKEILF